MKRNKLSLLILLSVFASLLWGCDDSPTDPKDEPSALSLQQAYLDAVADAKAAEENEVYDKLVSIKESNNSLIWDKDSDRKRVLVVTWTSDFRYHYYTGSAMSFGWEVWVTVVPEIRNFCNREIDPGENITLRIEQLLGLPPNNGKTFFVEIWVVPDDLFRPSPDPEITDSVAELHFPEDVSDDYRTWFNNLKSNSYGENGYPWTRLGYTYDWGNPENEIGLSEFVIKAGSTVEIGSVYCNDEYYGKEYR